MKDGYIIDFTGGKAAIVTKDYYNNILDFNSVDREEYVKDIKEAVITFTDLPLLIDEEAETKAELRAYFDKYTPKF